MASSLVPQLEAVLLYDGYPSASPILIDMCKALVAGSLVRSIKLDR